MKSFFRTRWRIIGNAYGRFEIEFRPWWCPFWVLARTDGQNDFCTVEQAERVFERTKNMQENAGKVVRNLE